MSKMSILWKILKISELIQDDHKWFQGASGRRSERQSYQKTHQLEKFEKFQNHPKPTTSDFENGSKSQISLCWRTIFLQMSSGASWSIILLIWCEALSFIFVPGRQHMQSGPLTRNLVTFNFGLLVLSINRFIGKSGGQLSSYYIKVSVNINLMARGLDESSSRTQTCQKRCQKCQIYGKFWTSQNWSEWS